MCRDKILSLGVCLSKFLQLPAMAAVTELKNGMWFVHWFAFHAETIVDCGQTSLELKWTIVNSKVNLLLRAIHDNMDFSPGCMPLGHKTKGQRDIRSKIIAECHVAN